MENKCLVTKLDSVVNNDSLPVLGSLVLNGRLYSEGNYDTSQYVGRVTHLVYDSHINGMLAKVYHDDGTIVKTYSNNNEFSYTYPATNQDYSTPVNINVYYKYRITGIYMLANDGKDRTIDIPNLDEIYMLPKLRAMQLGSNEKLKGDAEYIMPNFVNRANITLIHLSSTNLTGDIAKTFGDYVSLTALRIYKNRIVGTIEELCERQENRTSGTLAITFTEPYARPTFNSNPSSSFSIVFSDDTIVVSSGSTQLGSYNKSSREWTYN